MIHSNQPYTFDSDNKKDFIKQVSNQFQKIKDVIWTSNLSLVIVSSKKLLKHFLCMFIVIAFIKSQYNNLLANGWKVLF